MVTMLTNPESLAAEEYRRLCFNVEWGIRESMDTSCKTLAVMSAVPGEGKTITSINLAMTLARNHRVLLIDTNLRKPSIHRIFKIPQEQGVSDLIANRNTPNLYVPDGSPALSIMQAGLSLTWPADLLGSTIMTDFVESLKETAAFDYVVFDVPPAAYLPDAPIIASKVSGIVWVIQELRTSKDDVQTALRRITNLAMFGVVLNKSEQRIVHPKHLYVPPPIKQRKKTTADAHPLQT
jgi:capsular exopolysaccharide synthesis family protein